MSVKSFFFDRALLLVIIVAGGLTLWWLTADIIVALVCLLTLIVISIIARLYQPWDEKKVIEKLNTQTQKKSGKNFPKDR